MDFTGEEKSAPILSHCLFGLARYNLIAKRFVSGDREHINRQLSGDYTDTGGILAAPTLFGPELFLWALGVTGASGLELLSISVLDGVEGITIPDGAAPVEEMKRGKMEWPD